MSTQPGTEQHEYSFSTMEAKWPAVWEELDVFAPADDGSRERRYVLDMFPYPSGDLHMGHAEAFAMGDVVARYWRLKGYDVLHPIGWDSFGLPAENAAIKRNAHPASGPTPTSRPRRPRSGATRSSFDWSRRLHTSDPEYYRWTQWLFLRFYERGLAYRKDQPVNWCPKDQTVLANEQVVAGAVRALRHAGHQARADPVVLQDHRVRRPAAGRHGRAGGPLAGARAGHAAQLDRPLRRRARRLHHRGPAHEPVTVFTTRPDTLYGATFFVVAADAAAGRRAGHAGAARRRSRTTARRPRRSPTSTASPPSGDKTGVFLGRYAVNPLNGEQLPVWAADYVLADYGTGAIMAVPAHDQRDLDFARAFDLPVRVVVDTGEEDPAVSGVRHQRRRQADQLRRAGRPVQDGGDRARHRAGGGRRHRREAVNFRLRDWLLSRQRFWGAPIPIVHCDECGEVPVPDDQLPVRLPDDLRGEALSPKGTSPLAAAADWVNTDCPNCGKAARRDTDTMDTFVDSSWYFLRFRLSRLHRGPVRKGSRGALAAGGPVRGRRGARDPAPALQPVLHQGAEGHGHDRFRRAVPCAAEPGPGAQRWQGDEQVAGQRRGPERTAGRVRCGRGPADHDLCLAARRRRGLGRRIAVRLGQVPGPCLAAGQDVASAPGTEYDGGDRALRSVIHRTVADAADLLDAGKFNVVIAKLMELVNATRKAIDAGPGAADPAVREATEAVAIILSLFAPYTAEDLWAQLGHEPSVVKAAWPAVDESCWCRRPSRPWFRLPARCATGWRCRRTSARTNWRSSRWPRRRSSAPSKAARCAR